MEYKVLQKKFFKALQKDIGDDLVGIVVYGSVASDLIFSGVSDIDFFIILKSVNELSKPLSEVYQKIGDKIKEFVNDPLFGSILDYDIYLMDQLPEGKDLKGFSPIRLLSLSKGLVLVGENPLEGYKVSNKQLKEGAHRMVQEYLDTLTKYLFIPVEEEKEQQSLMVEMDFYAVDAVLSSAQAYYILKKGEYVTMPDVTLFAETEPIDGVDNEIVIKAGFKRQGIETEVDDFINRAINFVGDIIAKLGEK